ncbi:MAG: metallophosphoesterase [Ruminococcaceae bacterium]|nr:metallophosphoesterase [Oscillospiraceae bacterium]
MLPRKPLSVTVITDTHYFSKRVGTSGSEYDKANAKSQKLLKYSAELLDAAYEQIKKDSRTDIVLLSGDTTNEGELWAHEEAIEQLRGLKKAGKRVYVLTATHDYKSEGFAWGYDGDKRIQVPAVKREELFDMYREFGPDEAIAVHRDSMSFIVQLEEGYRLFAINDDSNLSGKSGVSDELYEWIKVQADDARANGQFIIAMTHHPLIPPSPIYEIIGKGDMFGDYDIRREQFADIGIQFMLTGHTHIHDIDKYTSARGNTFYDIATAALIGYPGTMRNIVLDPDNNIVKVTTDFITEPVKFDLEGKTLQEYLAYQLAGMIKDMIKAAGSDTDTFASMATAMSIKKKLVYKIGWLIKPVAKYLNRLTIGKVAKWTKKETGLKPEDYADIKDKSVVDFIVDMVLNLYGGANLYNPEDPEYKICMGLISIIDSVFDALHIKVRKLLKVCDSLHDLVEPLIHSTGIPSYDAELPIMPFYNQGEQGPAPAEEPKPEIKKSKKGVPIVIITVLLAIIFLIPLILILGVGFIVNQIRYGKKMKD